MGDSERKINTEIAGAFAWVSHRLNGSNEPTGVTNGRQGN